MESTRDSKRTLRLNKSKVVPRRKQQRPLLLHWLQSFHRPRLPMKIRRSSLAIRSFVMTHPSFDLPIRLIRYLQLSFLPLAWVAGR